MSVITNVQGFIAQSCLPHYLPSYSCENEMLGDKVSCLGNELLMIKTVHGGFISADKKAQLLEQGASTEQLEAIQATRGKLLGGMRQKPVRAKPKVPKGLDRAVGGKEPLGGMNPQQREAIRAMKAGQNDVKPYGNKGGELPRGKLQYFEGKIPAKNPAQGAGTERMVIAKDAKGDIKKIYYTPNHYGGGANLQAGKPNFQEMRFKN